MQPQYQPDEIIGIIRNLKYVDESEKQALLDLLEQDGMSEAVLDKSADLLEQEMFSMRLALATQEDFGDANTQTLVDQIMADAAGPRPE